MLRDELTTDPAGLGYVLTDPAQIELVINAKTRTRIVSHFASERGILDRYPGGPVQADALLVKLEAFAQSANTIAGIVRRALKFLATPEGIDLGSNGVQSMLAALKQGGVITQAELDGLRSMATKPCSRAEEIGIEGGVTKLMVIEALDGIAPPAWTAEVLGVATQGANVVANVRYTSAKGETVDEQVPGNDLTTDALAAWMRRKVHLLTLRDLSLATF